MRESIGGAWLFGIVIVFITLFASFLTYSISYTKAFNTKNKIIEFIEHNEGYNRYDGDIAVDINAEGKKEEVMSTVEGKIFDYMSAIGYNYSTEANCDNGDETGQGYCLKKICPYDNNISDVHYKVTTYINLEIPIIGISMRIPISGETRVIYRDIGAVQCSNQ